MKYKNDEDRWEFAEKLLKDKHLGTLMELEYIGTKVQNGIEIDLYKNQLNKRYINIDSLGNCYKYNGLKGEYSMISQEEAIEYVK